MFSQIFLCINSFIASNCICFVKSNERGREWWSGNHKILSRTASKSHNTKTPHQEKIFFYYLFIAKKGIIPLDNGSIGSVIAKSTTHLCKYKVKSLMLMLGKDLRGLLHLGWMISMYMASNNFALFLYTMTSLVCSSMWQSAFLRWY